MLEKIKKKYDLKIGYLPTRRNVFSADEAGKYKNINEAKIREYDTEIVNLDFLNSEGLIFSGADAEKTARKFIDEDVDAIFAPHCNFGTEDAVARTAKRVGKPILIWGPRDDAPQADGIRLRDTQCGLFATSKALQRYGVPFTYITNCRVDDEVFDRGFKNFLSVASIIKQFRHLRIGQIDTRPRDFLTVMFNEGEILEKFGIETVPASLVDIEESVTGILKNNDKEFTSIIDSYRSKIKNITISDEGLHKSAALKLAMTRWAEAEELSAIGIQCWDALQKSLGIFPCFTNADLTDDGLPVSCETDILGAVTSLMLQAARRGETPVFFSDLTIRHPDNPNAELLWHCGNFPFSLAADPDTARVEDQFGGLCPAAGRWELRGGDITISKFDGVNGEYRLLMGHAKGTSGPENVGTYLWAEFGDWPKWEHKFIYGPYIHHIAVIHGHVAPALYEACKYIPGVMPDPVEPAEEEIQRYLRGE